MGVSNKICIIGGLGHVGLPLALSFADIGFEVTACDLDREKIKLVSAKKMPFFERGAGPILRRTFGKKFFVTDDSQSVRDSRFVIVVIGTPVDAYLNPNYKHLKRLIRELAGLLNDRQHLILRSTLFPGTTEKIRDYLRSRGLKTKVSFCPERIAQGNAIEELKMLPQIVASFDEPSRKEVTRLFLRLNRNIVPLTPFEAELAKLFTNSWRYIQFAIANQFYQLTAQQGLDWPRIYRAITHKYPRAASFPFSGFAAGPCLLKDTMQLTSFSNHSFFLGHAAMLVNEGLPNFIVESLRKESSLRKKTVGILGMTFKADSDDDRDSLAFKLKKILEIEAHRVLCSDFHLQDQWLVSEEKLLKESDIIILGAPHSKYRQLKLPKRTRVIDVWNFFDRKESR